jgi:hypothetical protein
MHTDGGGHPRRGRGRPEIEEMAVSVFSTAGHQTRRRQAGELGLWLAHPAQGYFLDYSQPDPQYSHVFCGPNEDPHAMCPNCARPYLRYMLLDTSDPRLDLSDLPFRFLPLYYCWGCNGRMLWYRLDDDGAMSERWFAPGTPVPDHPYPDYPTAFPAAPASLVPLSPEQQELLRLMNSGELVIHYQKPFEFLVRPVHQVGGEPHFVERFTSYEVECPTCKEAMPFLFTAGNDNLDPRGFTENDYVQTVFHLCRDCSTVAVFTESD